MEAPHLPFSCKFNDNETLASYANGIYDYYDVEQIEEFVAFMGAYEIESFLKSLKILMIRFIDLKILLYLNIVMRIMNTITILMHLLRKMFPAQEETNILLESMEEEIDEHVSSSDEKDDEVSEEQKEEERISYPCHLLMRVTLELIHCLMSLSSYRRMNAMIIAIISLIRLKYPFLMMLVMLVSKMPI